MRPFKRALAHILTPEELSELRTSLEIIGDIAVIRLPDSLLPKAGAIAKALMEANRQIKAVFRQASPVSGSYRVRRLEWIGGENRTVTIHREYGYMLKVDIAEAYFSPRLHFERARVASQVKRGELVLNMFAGVGSFSIAIAKLAEPSAVYSVDINPVAAKFIAENAKINKVRDIVIPIVGDAKQIAEACFRGSADRVLMPLPEKALEYLDAAIGALKPGGGWVHYYDFEHARKGEDPIEKVVGKVLRRAIEVGADVSVRGSRVVRSVGPNWYQVVLDLWARLR